MHNNGVTTTAFLGVQIDLSENGIGVEGPARTEHVVSGPPAEHAVRLGRTRADALAALTVARAVGVGSSVIFTAVLQCFQGLRRLGLTETTLAIHPVSVGFHARGAISGSACAVLRLSVVGQASKSGRASRTLGWPVRAQICAAALAGLS